jgi:RND family efflux transporter MFP subunit
MTRPASRHLCAVLVLFAACGRGGSGEADTAVTRVPVGLGTIVRDSLPETLTLTGRLEARPGGSAVLAAPAAGVVRAVRVQVGDKVPRGGVVAELDVPELAGDAEQKAAAAAQAGREAARQQGLLADGITSARQAEEAAATARQATAAAAAARDLLARTRVTSPVAGRVQEVLVQQGERVDAGRALAQIVAPDTLDLAAPVPAPELGRLRVGLPADVTQDGDTAPARGWLAALAPGVDSLTNAGEAVIRVPNREGRLHPGAAATARVRLGVRRDVLVVSDSALVLAGDSSVVFVVGTDSVAHQRAVERGVRAGGRTEIRGDVRSGDRVVTTGAFGLQDGMHVVPGAEPGSSR